jgi:hypothetical protein
MKIRNPINHILVAYYNMEGRGHGPLDFHAFTTHVE